LFALLLIFNHHLTVKFGMTSLNIQPDNQTTGQPDN